MTTGGFRRPLRRGTDRKEGLYYWGAFLSLYGAFNPHFLEFRSEGYVTPLRSPPPVGPVGRWPD